MSCKEINVGIRELNRDFRALSKEMIEVGKCMDELKGQDPIAEMRRVVWVSGIVWADAVAMVLSLADACT